MNDISCPPQKGLKKLMKDKSSSMRMTTKAFEKQKARDPAAAPTQLFEPLWRAKCLADQCLASMPHQILQPWSAPHMFQEPWGKHQIL